MATIIYCLCHGKTEKHGETADTYDASLTEESVKKLQQLEIPAHDMALCGLMGRHKETAKAVGLANCLHRYSAGEDVLMFALAEGDEEQADKIWEYFLGLDREMDGKSILVVTSRYLPILLKYYLNGGKAKFGSLKDVFQRVEKGEDVGDITMPESGRITMVTL